MEMLFRCSTELSVELGHVWFVTEAYAVCYEIYPSPNESQMFEYAE